MDIRNVQKTGNMFYVYLPTSWCKQHKISSNSKLSLDVSNEGNLILSPSLVERKYKDLELNIKETDDRIIHKLIVACYINPANSFKINLNKTINETDLLNQKKLISLESVEIDKKKITCEGSISILDPLSLLKTMVRKVRNMIIIIRREHNNELIERYEEEIDRSKLLIDKSIIDSMTFNKPIKLKTIDLYYISLIAKDLERIVDEIIKLKDIKEEVLLSLDEIINSLKDIIENIENIDYNVAIEFIKKTISLKDYGVKDVQGYVLMRIKHFFINISEVLTDWAITKKLEE